MIIYVVFEEHAEHLDCEYYTDYDDAVEAYDSFDEACMDSVTVDLEYNWYGEITCNHVCTERILEKKHGWE